MLELEPLRVCETSAACKIISCRWTLLRLPQCGLSAITANQQQLMGIQCVHYMKGNRGALDAFKC